MARTNGESHQQQAVTNAMTIQETLRIRYHPDLNTISVSPEEHEALFHTINGKGGVAYHIYDKVDWSQVQLRFRNKPLIVSGWHWEPAAVRCLHTVI